jgi:hypothetical protein
MQLVQHPHPSILANGQDELVEQSSQFLSIVEQMEFPYPPAEICATDQRFEKAVQTLKQDFESMAVKLLQAEQ